MSTAAELAKDIGVVAACDALTVARPTFYRHNRGVAKSDIPCTTGRKAPLALDAVERQRVLDLLHSEPFIDMAPHQVYAQLLDQGEYLCSIRTMYRLLKAEHGCVKERRRHVQRPAYSKPELLATGPNQVWSWDISVPQQAA